MNSHLLIHLVCVKYSELLLRLLHSLFQQRLVITGSNDEKYHRFRIDISEQIR